MQGSQLGGSSLILESSPLPPKVYGIWIQDPVLGVELRCSVIVYRSLTGFLKKGYLKLKFGCEKRDIFHLLVCSHKGQEWALLKPGLESSSGIPHGWPGPQYLGHSLLLFSGH